MKPVATLLLVLNFCMFVIILGIGGWAMNRAIDHGFIIGISSVCPCIHYTHTHTKRACLISILTA